MDSIGRHAIGFESVAYTGPVERVLVTGAASWIGGRVVQELEPHHEVIAVDELEPKLAFAARLHRYSMDSLDFAQFLVDRKPTTVIHLQTLDRSAEIGNTRSRAGAVQGAQALFGAIERVGSVHHVVVKSDAAIYSTGPRHASVLSESTRISGRATRYERNLRDIERFVADLKPSMPEVSFTVLRLGPILGPAVGNPISRYLTLPVVPTLMGYDGRLQFLYEDDAVQAIVFASRSTAADGIFNVAGDGILYLSRLLRIGRRLGQPLPPPLLKQARRFLAVSGVPLPEHTANLLKYGRYTTTDRMVTKLGFNPAHTTRQAIERTYRGAR